MTMPHERSRAVVEARKFLVEISRDQSLPERLRRDAKFVLRHYPSESEVLMAGRIEEEAQPFIASASLGAIFSSSIEYP